MKKSLLVLMILVLSLPSWADTTRGDALVNCIHLIDDSAVLIYFPSRLLDQRSAVFLRVGDVDSAVKNTVFLPGVQLINSAGFSFSYYYGRPLGTTPAMMANPSLGFTAANYSAPVSLILGKTLGSLKLGLGYILGIYSTDSKLTAPDGTLSNTMVSSYQLHQLQPSLTMSLGKATLDASLLLGIHFLNNSEKTAFNTNQTSPASFFQSLGLQAQYTLPLSAQLSLAVRVGSALSNLGYSAVTGSGSTNAVTNKSVRQQAQIDLTAGLKYSAAPSVDIFFDMLAGYHVNYQQNSTGTNITSTTDNRYFILPVSTRLGIEFSKAAWSFRLAVRTAMSATQTRAGATTTTVFGPLVTRAMIGLGWQKGDWTVNAVINPALFNDTIFIISGAGVQPVLQLSVNYLFPDKKAVNSKGDGSQ